MNNPMPPKPPRMKDNAIKFRFCKLKDSSPDWSVVWGNGTHKADARLICNALSELGDELVKRGYERASLRFSINKSPAPYKTETSN